MPDHQGNLFAALLLLEKAQQAAIAHCEGWSPVSFPELQSSCPVPRFDAAVPTPDHTSCSESESRTMDRSQLILHHVLVTVKNLQLNIF